MISQFGGEHERFLRIAVFDFEIRSSATGRKSDCIARESRTDRSKSAVLDPKGSYHTVS